MRISTLLEVLTAAHLTPYVEASEKLNVRGGIMLVAPPASLKSTIIKQVTVFPDAMVLSDMNVRQIMQIRDDVANGLYKTLAMTEFGKLYQRQDVTSSNVEGHIAAMVDEGFRLTSNEDQRMVARTARCLFIAGMTQDLYRRKFPLWLDAGFARRFIWCHYIMRDRNALVKAIHAWKPLEIIPDMIIFGLPKESIPYSLTEKESGFVMKILRPTAREMETPLVLLKKIACVLKWRYKDQPGRMMATLEDFAECLTKDGAMLDIK